MCHLQVSHVILPFWGPTVSLSPLSSPPDERTSRRTRGRSKRIARAEALDHTEALINGGGCAGALAHDEGAHGGVARDGSASTEVLGLLWTCPLWSARPQFRGPAHDGQATDS